MISRTRATRLSWIVLIFTLLSSTGCAGWLVGYVVGKAVGGAIRNASKTTCEEFKKELLKSNTYDEKVFYKEFGKPENTYQEGTHTIFIYDCSDGQLLVYLDTAHLAKRKVVIQKIECLKEF